MRILAIETTDLSGSVAALEADRIVACRDLNSAARSAVSLAPAIAELLRDCAWQAREVQLVAVASGPGSFTGLRVGVTTAKMFAYAVRAKVVGVNTLEAVAWQSPEDVGEVWAVLDAQRDQLFAARFRRDSSAVWQPQSETLLLGHDAWISQLTAAATQGIAVSGPGLEKLVGKFPQGIRIIDRPLWAPKAQTVGRLAWRQFQSKGAIEPAELMPQYFRPSAAEEKRGRSLASPS